MRSSTFHDLIGACKKTGCPICRVEARILERYIDNLFYESVNDIKTRERLRASLGFCREHAHLAMDIRLGNALGFAIIYQDVITNILRGFEEDTNIAKALTPREGCMVCQQREKTTQLVVSAFVDGLTESQMQQALRTSDGLCIPHLKKVAGPIRDLETIDLLRSIHREKLESLHRELAEFIRKNDYRFKDEGFGTERDSWKRAVHKLTGNRFGTQN